MAKEHSRLVDALQAVPDPRRQCRNLRHRLVDVLVMGFCAVLGGCDDFVEIAAFAQAKEDFFRRFLDLPHGIPSHDTFRRVFQSVGPQGLQDALIDWLRPPRPPADGTPTPIALDGKTLRRTFDHAKGLGALHLVSAWASEHGLTLGQVAVDGKSNEITAFPALLQLLDLHDSVVTIDAAGCQKEIAAQIIEQQGDYVLALKGNHPTLHEQVSDHFLAYLDGALPDAGVRHHGQVEQGHGRTETRDTYVAPVPKGLHDAGLWLGLCSLVMVIRESVDHATAQTSSEVRYFLSSLKPTARRLAGIVRGHWGIENGLHWVLDLAFNEDRLRVRDRRGIENLALLNRLAISVLRQDKTVKAGVKCKRKRAGWDEDYLLHLLLHDS